MASYDYDLFVIGGGSGGVRAARIAAQYGARVAVAEEYRYGGTCVIRGCVPKKLFVYASEVAHDLESARGFGWEIEQHSFDWPTLVARKDAEIDRLNKIYISLLERSEVTVLNGRAQLVEPHVLEVAGVGRVSARIILVATGGRPYLPDVPGVECSFTSNEAFHLPALPQHVTVVGGGFIAVEFAHIFNGLGCRVSMVHRRPHMLRGFDEDLRVAVTDGLRARGVALHMNTEVAHIEQRPTSVCLTLQDGNTIESDTFMCATGRVPNTDCGLAEVGVELGRSGAVVVDDYSRSTVENIYAVGDCTGRVALTPVAIREGQAFADTVFGDKPTTVDYDCIPAAVFAQPTAATVGLSEAAAREKFDQVDIYKALFRPMKHTLSGSSEKVLTKLVVDGTSQRVVGVHIVGDGAAEMIQCVAIAVKMGATKADFDATMALHPTTSEELVLMKTKS